MNIFNSPAEARKHSYMTRGYAFAVMPYQFTTFGDKPNRPSGLVIVFHDGVLISRNEYLEAR